jgi:hypothetical protein
VSIPVPAGVTVSNIGFSCPRYHDGDGDGNINFSSTAWTGVRNTNDVSWACETQAANIRANAIRWGCTYNFRFDANVAPGANANVTVGLWKAGSPASFAALAQVPGTPSIPLAGTGSATPSTVQITSTSLLKVTVTPGTAPASTGIAVTTNLSAINGSTSQTFYDNGTNGDVTAGDNVFSFLATIAEPASAGPVSLPFSVTDAQARNGAGSIGLTLTAAPTGSCCTGIACSITSAYACTTGSGTYNGNGTPCEASTCGFPCGTSDYDGDGDFGTDADIAAFFACLGGDCCPTCYSGGSDFNGDGDSGTDSDIQSFFAVLGGSGCVY